MRKKVISSGKKPFDASNNKSPSDRKINALQKTEIVKQEKVDWFKNFSKDCDSFLQKLRKLTQIPTFIKDNWLAVVGSLACIVGTVFFGITSGLLHHPEMRIAVMIAFSALLIVFSVKLSDSWNTVRSLFRSLAGAIILFCAVGAGGITGLKCVNSPAVALSFLCLGISINIYLATISPFQMISSSHVLLSLVAFCIAPQNLLFIPLGAIVTIVGMLNSYRSKWDIHLILILFGFAILNTLWTWKLDLTSSMHYLGIFCPLIISTVAAFIHYRKKYKSTQLEPLPFIAHLSNWILLVWNIHMHAEVSKASFFILSGVAVIGFFLAQVAKKKEITWLYYTDTCVSQIVALGAIATLYTFSIKLLDICILALIEIVIFNLINNFLKQNILIRIGYFMQTTLYIVCAGLIVHQLYPFPPLAERFPLYYRIGIVIAISWGFYMYARTKEFTTDTFSYLLYGEESNKDRFSLMVIFGTLFFLFVYMTGSKAFSIQCITLLVFSGIAFWRSEREDLSWELVFLIMLSCLHLYSWSTLLIGQNLDNHLDFVSLVVVDIILIFRNMLQLKIRKMNIHNLVIYAVAVQIGLITHICCKEISLYIPALAFLGYSLIALETSHSISFEEPLRSKVRVSLLHVGVLYVVYYLYSFITLHLQLEGAWKGISLRIISEVLGSCALAYWVIHVPKTLPRGKINTILFSRFIELFLGFISLAVLTEVPDLFRPIMWTAIALSLIIGVKHFQWSERLHLYSWVYLLISIIHTVFITSYLTFSKQSFATTYFLPAIGATILQLLYAFIAHTREFQNSHKYLSLFYRRPTLTTLLPVFLGIALFFTFNYEKALLTLFWVILSSIYLALSLLAKAKDGVLIGMLGLIICIIRLAVFDLMHSNLSTQAVVFFSAGILMMLISMTYKKYKHRLEAL